MSQASRSYPRKRLWKWAIGSALLAGVLACWPHLRLAATIATAAREEFPQGVEYLGSIHQDHFESLTSHPPTRVAKYLQAPWPQWRAVVCHALADENWPSDTTWNGVPARLAAVALSDPNTFVRQLAQSSLRRALPIVPDETAAPFSQALAAPAGPDRDEVLRILAEQPTTHEPLRLALLDYRTSAETADRWIALELLAEYSPGDLDEELVTLAFAPMVERPPRNSTSLREIRQTIVLKRPDLALALLDGDPARQIATLSAFCEVQESLDSERAAVRRSMDPGLLAKASAVALTLVDSPNSSTRQTALDYLALTPAGGQTLIQAAQQMTGDHQRSILATLGRFTSKALDRGGFQFTAAETEALFALLVRSEPACQESILSALAPSWENDRLHSLYPARYGPASVDHRAVLLRLTGHADDKVAGAALHCVNQLLVLEESEVEAVAAAVRRNSSLAPAASAYTRLASRFPRHPRTLELARETIPAAWPWLAEEAELHLLKYEPRK